MREVARKRVGGFSLGMGQRLGIAAALLGDPATVILDEPANGLDPEGIHWIRNLLKNLAAEGRTVFLSSHLMSEMAQTAEHLIVIGRGRLIADTSVAEFVRRASSDASVRVRSPQGDRAARGRSLRRDVQVQSIEPGLLEVNGLTGEQIGEIALAARIVISELTPHQASLEEAFMSLTGESVEYHAGAGAQSEASENVRAVGVSAIETLPAAPAPSGRVFTGRVTQAHVLRSEWTKLWSLRSTRWSLLFAVVAMAGLGVLIAAVSMSRWSHLSPHDQAHVRLDRPQPRRLSPRPARDRCARGAGDQR